jgi:hypothetical protein
MDCLPGRIFTTFEGISTSDGQNLRGFNAFVDIQDVLSIFQDSEVGRAGGKEKVIIVCFVEELEVESNSIE